MALHWPQSQPVLMLTSQHEGMHDLGEQKAPSFVGSPSPALAFTLARPLPFIPPTSFPYRASPAQHTAKMNAPINFYYSEIINSVYSTIGPTCMHNSHNRSKSSIPQFINYQECGKTRIIRRVCLLQNNVIHTQTINTNGQWHETT